MSRIREAPTPTNISTKSEPEIEKKGTPASPAIARASSSLDRYTRQLHQLGLESSEREVKWLNELIAAERVATAGPTAAPPPTRLTAPPSPGHADQT